MCARLLACLTVALYLLTGLTAAHAQEPPPIASFFGRASLLGVTPSPSGRWLASRVDPGDGSPTRLVISDLRNETPAKVVAAFSRAHVTSVTWVNEDLLVFEIAPDLVQAYGARYSGLASVTRDGESLRLLVKMSWDTEYAAPGAQPLEANHVLLALGEPGSDEIIVGEYQYDARGEYRGIRPLALNARDRSRRSLGEHLPINAQRWMFDHRGRPRLATTRDGDVLTYHWFDLAQKAWRKIADFKVLDSPFEPLFIVGDDQLYVQITRSSKDAEDAGEVRRFDFETLKPAADALVATPGYSENVWPVIDRRDGSLRGLNVLVDVRARVWLRPGDQALQSTIDAKLPGRINRMLCARCDELEAVVVYSYSDRVPGDYLLYHPKRDEWQRIGKARPAIDADRMSPLSLHRVKARDGLEIPVWITRPADSKPARPAVVLVHGGPWVRGSEWRWDAEAQFLASRGYVVVEPEFRGSTGYGTRLFRAGFRQWGRAMQDDVTDALKFAVDQGWVDPKRVCIAGASYGGYATLMGLVKDPDQYRCGVAWVAVSDPSMMFSVFWSDITEVSKRYSYKRLIGDPEVDAAMFKAISPLEQASRIKAPVLLAYGALDRRVPIVHGEKMREALLKAGQKPEWVVYQNEHHGWSRDETRLDFWQRVEKFLAQHLGP
ncbi:MAG TPA: alpha/beta fold hydrolase [Burkholderiaceae bacterium]|nr:alpha/beta fold hydrolase [Burkholderiaceae bacterium]